jgi:carbamoyl-phosphate synthase large subunit
VINVLVLGAGGTAGINFIESLMMTGNYNVVGCDINQWHLKLVENKFKIKTYLVPHYTHISERVDFINDVIKKENIKFIHAQPDVEVEFLSRNRDEINTMMFLPYDFTIEKCRNKYQTALILGGLAPITSLVNEERIESQIKTIQTISGSEKVWLRAVRGAGSKAALPITTAKQALDWIHYWVETKHLETYDFILSEFLPGKEYAFQSIWFAGNIVTSMARERIEYLMGNLFPSGQSSSPSVAVTVHSEMVNTIATEAMWRLDEKASGIFCIDMKCNQFGRPLITEINAGRFFTTSNFFSHYGANMPDTYVKMGLGLEVGILEKYNAIPKGKVWVRGVDTLPYGFEEN